MKEGSKFCGKCGKRVEQIRQKQGIQKDKKQESVTENKRKKKRINDLGMKIGLVAFFVGLIGFMYIQGRYKYLAMVIDENGKCGYINERGTEVVECKYDVTFPFQKGGIAVVGNRVGEDGDGNAKYKYGIIDKKGNEITPLKYDNARNMLCNVELVPVAMAGEKDEEGDTIYNWGFINKKGEQVIDFKYQYKSDSVPYSEKMKKGIIIVSVRSTKKDEWDDNIYNYGVINSKGEEIIPISDQRIGEYNWENIGNKGLFVVEREDKYGVINLENKVTVPIQYDQFFNFSDNGLAAEKKMGCGGI